MRTGLVSKRHIFFRYIKSFRKVSADGLLIWMTKTERRPIRYRMGFWFRQAFTREFDQYLWSVNPDVL